MKKYINKIIILITLLISTGFNQSLCEPIYNVERQILTYSAGKQMFPDDCNPSTDTCENTFIIVGQPFMNTASQHTDANNNYLSIDIIGEHPYTSSNTNADGQNSFGYFNDYIAEPKPPIVKASDGDFQEKVLVEWEIQGCHIDDSDCASTGPQISEGVVTLYRNGYVLTTLPIAQTEYQDFNVFPGEYYTYGVTVANNIGNSQKGVDVGFLNPNGVITGNIETPSGTPMAHTKVVLSPNLGRSAKFNGDGYVYWFDDVISGNRQFDQLKSDYTIEFWFESIFEDSQTLFSAVDSGMGTISVEIFLDAEGHVNWHHGGQLLTSHNSYIEDGEWHHLAVVKSGIDMTMYIDGFLIRENSDAMDINNPHGNNLEFVLGKKSPLEHNNYFTGRLDDFRIWNAAREWDDILNLMDITLSGSEENLYAYFKFDEVDGETVFDLTAGNRDGSTCRVERDDQFAPVFQGALTDENGNYAIQGIYYAGGTTFTVTPEKSTPIGRSVELDGNDDYISFGAQLIDLSSAFTVEGWFKSSENSEQVIFSAVDSLDNSEFDLSVRLNTNGNIEMIYGSDQLTSQETFNEGLWHHFAVTYIDSLDLVGYIDGIEFASTPITYLIEDDSKIIFGADYDQSSNLFSGRIDEFRIWDLVRNPEQLNGAMDQTLTGEEFGLVHYWQMNDGTGTILTNSKSTIVGTLNGETDATNYWSKDIPLNEYFDHWYEPESRQATLNHTNTSIDQVSFTDQSLIPVSGYVRFDGTSCFHEGVEIKLNGQSTFPITMTDENGKFIVEVEPGSIGNIIKPYFMDSFSISTLNCSDGINSCDGLSENDSCGISGICQYQAESNSEEAIFTPGEINLPMVTQPLSGLYFNDKTVRETMGIVAGGTCNMSIPPSQGNIMVSINSINGCYENQIIFDNDQINYNFNNLPPLQYNLTVSHPDPSIDAEFQGESIDLENQNFFNSEFIFQPDIYIVWGDIFKAKRNSENELEEDYLNLNSGCSDFPLELKLEEEYLIYFKVEERYNDKLCDLKNYNYEIIDNISDTQHSSLINSQMYNVIGDSDYIHVNISPNGINLLEGGEHPYQQNLQLNIFSNDRTVSSEIWALIIGTETLDVNTFIVEPQSNVDFVLRVPPGDGSYSYIEQGQNWCSTEKLVYKNSTGIEKQAKLRAGLQREIEFGAGFVSTSIPLQSTVELGMGVNLSYGHESYNEISKCISTNETFTAFGDGLISGKDASVFIGSGFTYEIGMANELTLNSEECEIEINPIFEVTTDEVRDSFIHSRFYIYNVLIPLSQEIGDQISEQIYDLIEEEGGPIILDVNECKEFDVDSIYVNEFEMTVQAQTTANSSTTIYLYNTPDDEENPQEILIFEGETQITNNNANNFSFDLDNYHYVDKIKLCGWWNSSKILAFNFGIIQGNDIANHWINILDEEDERENTAINSGMIVGELEENYCGTTFSANCVEFTEFDDYCEQSVICDEDENISISYDAGATYEYNSNVTTTSTNSFQYDFQIDINLGVEWITQIGGWAHEVNNSINFSHTESAVRENSQSVAKTVGFVLADGDPGDGFFLNIKSDNDFDMPVFDLIGGQSSCPWEEKTLKRHKSQLIASPSVVYDVPPDEPAIITLSLGNASESGDDNFYNLSYLTGTNPDGALLWTDNNLALGVDYFLIAGGSHELTLQVFRGPEAYEYNDIILQLAPPCEKDIAFELGKERPENSDRINISVHFQEPCTESNIVVPEDGWLIDGSNTDQYFWVTVNGYDQFNENLESIDLQYRQVGGGDWFSAFNVPKPNGEWDEGESFTDADGNSEFDIGEDFVDVGCTIYCETDESGDEICEEVCLSDDYILLPFIIDPSITIDGEYELRTQAMCGGGKYPGTSQVVSGIIDRSAPEILGLPEPINGILSSDDLIKVTLNEDVQCGEISAGAGDIALFNTVTGNPVDFEFTCGGNIITIEPVPANIWLENQTLRAEIHNLEDLYGNKREVDEPIVWEFFVNRNPIEWTGTNIDNIVIRIDEEYSTTRQLVNNGGSNRSYEIIGGRESGLMSGDPLELPPWLNINPTVGTLTPGSAQNISLGLNEGLNFGHYQSTIFASGTMGDEPLIIDIRKLCHDPLWSINSSDFQYSMNLTATLTTDGEQSIDEYDFVGVFVGDELRGVAQVSHVPAIEDILDVAPYEVFLTIYSNEPTGDDLEFRVWDASECTELGHIEEDYTFNSNSVVGSLVSPANITATSQIISSLAYPQGFTWFSINLKTESMDLNSLFSGMSFVPDDIIKDQTSYSQYSFNEITGLFEWAGWLQEIDPQSMYLINIQNEFTLEMVGYAVDVELDTVNVSTGWNWIGFTPQYSIAINEALESLNSATGDIIKSQNSYAEFIENYGWFGSLSYMEPKDGYMLRSTYEGELLYPHDIRSNINPDVVISEPLLAENAPSWDININQFEHSMTVTAIGQVNGISLNDEMDMLGAFAMVETENGFIEECRGVTQPIYVEALDQYIGFLMVYSNIEGEDIYFKLFDANQDIVWSVYENSEFSSNEIVGELFEPYHLNAKPPIGDVSFDGILNIQDIMKVVNFILDVENLSIAESTVADLNDDNEINVADIVEMIGLILDSPLVKLDDDIIVEIRIQGQDVSIYSDNSVSGLQFNLPGHFEIQSDYDAFSNQKNGELATVITNLNGNKILDGKIFEFFEDNIEFNDLIIIGKNGEQLDFEIKYLPTDFGLSQNYPNPFNPETTINFELPEDSEITIRIYDINGRLINEILNSSLQASYHSLNWRAEDKSGLPLSNGIYFYRMITPQFTDVKKMLLIK
ncbi:MAG: T9SS type A sorting domain-containing protein [Candidatus Marinimicrobia bacterium]|nr:T9SS type A sorting domain-containing protein [Candidatus Neomarinimicrobiota bacterium]